MSSSRKLSRGSELAGAAVPVALVTGISGQDGSYLAELLLGKGYDSSIMKLIDANRRSMLKVVETIE